MKLLISHGIGEWEFAEFNAFRMVLARLLGYTIREQQYYVPDFPPHETKTRTSGTWSGCDPADPIDVLMYHSDNSGVIQVRHQEALMKRLQEMLACYNILRNYRVHDPLFAHKAERFAIGVSLAFGRNENVTFEVIGEEDEQEQEGHGAGSAPADPQTRH